jgi:hypothetical protein
MRLEFEEGAGYLYPSVAIEEEADAVDLGL